MAAKEEALRLEMAELQVNTGTDCYVQNNLFLQLVEQSCCWFYVTNSFYAFQFFLEKLRLGGNIMHNMRELARVIASVQSAFCTDHYIGVIV